MLIDHPTVRSALRGAAYVTAIGVVACLTGWSALRVGTTTVGMLDAKILDGSGRAQPEPDWTSPPLAADPRDEAPQPEVATGSLSQLTSTAIQGPATPLRVSTDDPGAGDPAADFVSSSRGRFRTYCVRLCDGYYFPISFATTADRFEADASACRSTCGSPARLFVHPIPGGGPGTMVSLDGLPYTSLKSAFLFRTKYDAQCRCQPQPWDQASRDTHQLFAVAAKAAKGDPKAAAEASALSRKVAEENATRIEKRDDADATATEELGQLARTATLKPPRSWSARQPIKTTDASEAFDFGFGQDSNGPRSGPGRNWRDQAFSGN